MPGFSRWAAFGLVLVLGCARGTAELDELPGPGIDGGGGVDANLRDVDGDGYDVDVDCNDNDGAVHPDAPELCDAIDQDCDGVLDEEPTNGTTFYADTDGDGYGDGAVQVVACNPPADHVPNPDDCYDANADAFPGQTEFFTTDRGDGSFDYDCSGGSDSSIGVGNCSFNGSNCGYKQGWEGSAPACGTTGNVVDGCLQICIGICICEVSTSSALNDCR